MEQGGNSGSRARVRRFSGPTETWSKYSDHTENIEHDTTPVVWEEGTYKLCAQHHTTPQPTSPVWDSRWREPLKGRTVTPVVAPTLDHYLDQGRVSGAV